MTVHLNKSQVLAILSFLSAITFSSKLYPAPTIFSRNAIGHEDTVA